MTRASLYTPQYQSLLRNRKWHLVHLLLIETRHSENKKVLLPRREPLFAFKSVVSIISFGLSCLLLCFLFTLQRYGLFLENPRKIEIIFADHAAKHIFLVLEGCL